MLTRICCVTHAVRVSLSSKFKKRKRIRELRMRLKFSQWKLCRVVYAASALMRDERRDNLRETVFFGNTPLVTARCSSGCALLNAASAAPLFPDEIASSTLRRKVLTRERRALFTAVRRAILRTIFLAEDVLAIFRHSIILPPAGPFAASASGGV